MADNPARPFDSPIKVTTAGDWTPNQWRHEASKPQPSLRPVPKSIEQTEEVINPTTKVTRTKITDHELEQAIQKDLKTKGIK